MNKAAASDYASCYCPETKWSSCEEFSGDADVPVFVKPAGIVGKEREKKRTALPPGMEHVLSESWISPLQKHYCFYFSIDYNGVRLSMATNFYYCTF